MTFVQDGKWTVQIGKGNGYIFLDRRVLLLEARSQDCDTDHGQGLINVFLLELSVYRMDEEHPQQKSLDRIDRDD